MGLRGRLAACTVGLGVALAVGVTSGVPAQSAGSARAPGWGPVRNLSGAAPSWALGPTAAAVDGAGRTFAVWVHTDESDAPVMFTHRRDGTGWSKPVAVPGSHGADMVARVGLYGAGDAVFAWVTGHRVRAVRRHAGGSWSPPVTVFRDPRSDRETLAGSMSLAVNDKGRAALGFRSREGTQFVVGFPDGSWGKPWTPPRAVPRASAARGSTQAVSPTSSGDSEVVVDRWGRITAVWGEGGWVGRVMTASRDVGSRWTKPRPLTGTIFFYGARAAVRPNGEVDVLVQPPKGNRPGFQVLRKPRDGGWVRSPKLGLGGEPWKPRMGVDGAGRVSVAWVNLATGALWRTEYSPSTGWSRKARVTRPGTAGDDYWLVVNDAGNAVLGWTGRRGAHPVRAVVRTPSGRWQAHPRTVSTGRGDSRGPALAVGPGGDAVMVWAFQPAGSTTSRIQASRHTP